MSAVPCQLPLLQAKLPQYAAAIGGTVGRQRKRHTRSNVPLAYSAWHRHCAQSASEDTGAFMGWRSELS